MVMYHNSFTVKDDYRAYTLPKKYDARGRETRKLYTVTIGQTVFNELLRHPKSWPEVYVRPARLKRILKLIRYRDQAQRRVTL